MKSLMQLKYSYEYHRRKAEHYKKIANELRQKKYDWEYIETTPAHKKMVKNQDECVKIHRTIYELYS